MEEPEEFITISFSEEITESKNIGVSFEMKDLLFAFDKIKSKNSEINISDCFVLNTVDYDWCCTSFLVFEKEIRNENYEADMVKYNKYCAEIEENRKEEDRREAARQEKLAAKKANSLRRKALYDAKMAELNK